MRNEAPRVAAVGLSERLGVIGHNADAAVGTLGQYALLLWRHRVVSEAVPWIGNAFAKVREQGAGRFIFLTAVEPGCNVMTGSDVRKKIAALLANYDRNIACAAIVFEGEGFRMTFVRSVITAINLASRGRFPNSVFSNLDAALSWIELRAASENGIVIESTRVLAAINRLRVL